MTDLRDLAVLVLISVISGFTLSFVHLGTKDKIAEARLEELKAGLGNVMPFMQKTYEEVDFGYKGKDYMIYEVREDGELLGGAVKMVSPEGYSGDMTFLVGVNTIGEVTGIQILEQRETPGLGTKATNKAWWGQFLGKTLDNFSFRVKQDGGDVDAITAATITSRAVGEYVGKGLDVFKAFIKERGDHG